MRHSIRFKLFAAASGLILFFVLVSWLSNNLLMEKYYFYIKHNSLIEDYKLVNNLYRGDPEEISLELEKLERAEGVHIIILDKNFEPKYDTSPKRKNLWQKLLPHPSTGSQTAADGRVSKRRTLKQGEMRIEKLYDNRLNMNFINLYSTLNNGDNIYIIAPAAAIHENVNIANTFYLFTGVVTLFLGCVLVFLLTGRFTKPIFELKEIARRMSSLDFSRRYPVKTADEVGQLGESINSLSEQLQKSIMELKEANMKLKEDIEKERKIDEMRKEFLSNVSHELKTPIALIQGYAEGLKMNVNEDEENKNFYCDVIMDEALKMNKLVKQILELSQMESGEASLERVDFQITQLVELVLRKTELMFKSKGILAAIEKEDDPMVNADFDKIEQVLMNYLNNAIHHVDDRKEIKVTVKQDENKVRVSVFNSGQHIPEESLDKIWTSFYKVNKARTRDYGGTGLGLSIVRAVQELHGNGYGVRNVPGGVEFWFKLDFAQN